MLKYTFAPIINDKTEKKYGLFIFGIPLGIAFGLEKRLVLKHKATVAFVKALSMINNNKVEHYEKDNFIYAHIT